MGEFCERGHGREEVVADNVIDRGRLVHVLADQVVGGQDGNLVGLWRSLAAVLLANDPDARIRA